MSPRKAKTLLSSRTTTAKLIILASPVILLLYLTVFTSQAQLPLTSQPIFSSSSSSSSSSAPADANQAPSLLPANAPLANQQANASRFCDNSTPQHPCIFDIGLNTGQDTSSYLSSPTARVVAVEANPTLIHRASEKFASAIRDNRLTLVRVGLTNLKPEDATSAKPVLTFWVNTANDKFGSFVESLGCRSARGDLMPTGDHTYCRRIEIATKTCDTLIREFGTPEYMKIDIEGMDRACFRSLTNVQAHERPKYLSVENVFAWDVDELVRLGYKKFKIVNQAVLEASASKEMKGNSGPWGEEAEDQFIGKRWHTEAEAKARLPLPGTVTIQNRPRKAWYDLHASM